MVQRDVTSQPGSSVRDRDRDSRAPGGPSRATTGAESTCEKPWFRQRYASESGRRIAGIGRFEHCEARFDWSTGPTRDRTSGRESWSRFGRQGQTTPDTGSAGQSNPETRRADPGTPTRRTPGTETTPTRREPGNEPLPPGERLEVRPSRPRNGNRRAPEVVRRAVTLEARFRVSTKSSGRERIPPPVAGAGSRAAPCVTPGSPSAGFFRYDRSPSSGGGYTQQGEGRSLDTPRQIGARKARRSREVSSNHRAAPGDSRSSGSYSGESQPRSFSSGSERTQPRSFQTQPRTF